MSGLADVKVGDRVTKWTAGYSVAAPVAILSVKAADARSVTTEDGTRWARSTGYEYGVKRERWSSPPSVTPLRPGDEEKVRHGDLVRTARRRLDVAGETNAPIGKMSAEQIEALVAALDAAIAAMGRADAR